MEEGPAVDEGQLERLYRLNEAYYRSLPEFEGDVANLRGGAVWVEPLGGGV